MEILLSVQEQRLADLMRVLQNRYSNSDSQSYSGEFSTGWTSGALSRLDDTANLKNKVSWSGTFLMPLPLGLQKVSAECQVALTILSVSDTMAACSSVLISPSCWHRSAALSGPERGVADIGTLC